MIKPRTRYRDIRFPPLHISNLNSRRVLRVPNASITHHAQWTGKLRLPLSPLRCARYRPFRAAGTTTFQPKARSPQSHQRLRLPLLRLPIPFTTIGTNEHTSTCVRFFQIAPFLLTNVGWQDESTFRAELHTASPTVLHSQPSLEALASLSSTSPTQSSGSERSRAPTLSFSQDPIESSSAALGLTGLEGMKAARGPWVDGEEPPQGSRRLDEVLENATEIDGGSTGGAFCVRVRERRELMTAAAAPTDHVTAELQALYSSFQRCLDLRDKYMRLSRQRLEDNPANYDGQFAPSSSPTSPAESTTFKPWKIYPAPPSPHWKERDPYTEATETTEEIAEREAKRREFRFEEVDIPGLEVVGTKKRFELDGNGVFQVYADGELCVLREWGRCELIFRRRRRRPKQATLRGSDD